MLARFRTAITPASAEAATPKAGAAPLTPEEKADAVRAGVADLLTDAPSLAFVDGACLARYLAARGGSVSKATKALRATLLWRKEFKPEAITWADVADLNTGRLELLDQRDNAGRPINFFRLRCPFNEGATAATVLRQWIYHIEAVVQHADEGAAAGLAATGKVVLVFDMKTFPDTKEPPLAAQIECLRLAQAHYPERLGLAVVCNPPTVFWMFWRALQPFLDPVTKAKVAFATSEAEVRAAIQPHMGRDVLYASLGGDKPDAAFDGPGHAAFMQAMEARRAARVEAAAVRLAEE